MGKHTKGPWRIKNVGEDSFTVQVWTDESHWSVLIATSGGINKFENARLIAAAPTMLEALETVLRYFSEYEIQEHGRPALGKAWGAVQDAIRKVTGEE